jgi:ceramide glucosyltransferase
MLDSDIEVGPGYLTAVVGALQDSDVGAVTCLYHGIATDSLCARLAMLSINLHFLPAVCLGLRLHLCRPCFGSTIAMRRDMLDRIGGFAAFDDALMDDYAIGQAVRSTGKEVVVLSRSVAHLCHGSSPREFFLTQLRYAAPFGRSTRSGARARSLRIHSPWRCSPCCSAPARPAPSHCSPSPAAFCLASAWSAASD